MITNKNTPGGFDYIEIQNASANARVALQGGHLFHYQQLHRKPLIWLSGKSPFEKGKAIRGGIPVCWPWFGQHPTDSSLPQHGLARTSLFELIDSQEPDKNSTELLLQLQSSAETLRLWPYRFQLLLKITVGPALTLALTTKNSDTKPFTITSALHSYFAIDDIGKVSVQGMDETEYLDLLTNQTLVQRGSIHIDKEVDRVYRKSANKALLLDGTRTVRISSEGSSSTVIWNPWSDKSKSMSDMEDDSYQTMLCIETANAKQDARTIAPGEEHCLKVSLTESV